MVTLPFVTGRREPAWEDKRYRINLGCKVRDRSENTHCAYERYPCQKWLNKSSSSSSSSLAFLDSFPFVRVYLGSFFVFLCQLLSNFWNSIYLSFQFPVKISSTVQYAGNAMHVAFRCIAQPPLLLGCTFHWNFFLKEPLRVILMHQTNSFKFFSPIFIVVDTLCTTF